MALAFHVEYWDRLGWPDRLAQPLFTARQRSIVARQGGRTVYTPHVVVQGKSWRDWRGLEAQTLRRDTGSAQALLTIAATQTAATQLEVSATVEVSEAAERSQAQIFLAMYENNLHSQVSAGENAGKTLRHDGVVRHWLGPFAVDAQGQTLLHHTLALQREWKVDDLGLVVLVQNPHNGAVLQVLGLALRNS